MTTHTTKRVSDTQVHLEINLPYLVGGRQTLRKLITSRFGAYRVLTELVDGHKDNGCGLFPEEVLLLWRDLSSCFVWTTASGMNGLRYYDEHDEKTIKVREYYTEDMSSIELKDQLKQFFILFEERLLKEIARGNMQSARKTRKRSGTKVHPVGKAPSSENIAPEVPVSQ